MKTGRIVVSFCGFPLGKYPLDCHLHSRIERDQTVSKTSRVPLSMVAAPPPFILTVA